MNPETDRDIENLEAWAEIIRNVLWHVPPDRRGQVLSLTTEREEAERQEREESPGLKFMTLNEDWANTPGARHRNAIMRLKSLLVQVFVRDIANNHSQQEAADILFVQHRHGTGSGLLEDYLPERKPAR